MPRSHLKLDVYNAPDDLLGNESAIHDVIDTLPRTIDMQVIDHVTLLRPAATEYSSCK